jgi:thiol-disulfide isomerase/thioredoxin
VSGLLNRLHPSHVEGRLPAFDGATGWLNSGPLTPEGLRGNVVLVDFWTYTCINWLRTLGYVRAWAEKYERDGLVVLGVHTPEFPFERDVDNVRWAIHADRITYPVAIDSRYGVWQAFGNHYWPAVYIADAEGRIRHHHFGEGGYEECERVVQQLLREAGRTDVADDLVAVSDEGFQVQADLANLRSPESYLGYEQAQNFASPGRPGLDESRDYDVPDNLLLNQWALAGTWAIERGASVLTGPEGRLAFRFHARDVNLVLGPPARGRMTVPFRVTLDGEPPGGAHGSDADANGDGIVDRPRLYQLVREPGEIQERTFEITFLDSGVEAYVFTFG